MQVLNPKHIIWDWNGTLLDDAKVCVEVINIMLKKRGLQQLSLKKYRTLFDFPVIEYYKKIGFDFDLESFDTVSIEFISLYNELFHNTRLYKGVIPVLEHFKRQNIKQHILSAQEQNLLIENLQTMKIEGYFNSCYGTCDHYANSKAGAGKKLIEEQMVEADTAVMIGDTLHDLEISKKMGCDILLVAGGHQDEKRLKNTGVAVVEKIEEVIDIIS